MRIEQLLENRLELTPSAPYMRFPQTGPDALWTYAEAATEAKRYAQVLADADVEPDDRVAVFLPNDPEYVFALFGNAYLGAVTACPHPAYTARELRHSLELSEPTTVLTSPERADIVDDAVEGTTVEQVFLTKPGDSHDSIPELAEDTPAFEPRLTDDDQIGFHLYTSGTTGPPKAVAQSHRSWTFAANHTQKWFQYSPDDVLMNVFPIAHGNAQIHTVLSGVAGGSEIVIFEQFSSSQWWDWCREYGVTAFNTMGSVLKMLDNLPEKDDDAENSVRVACTAGAPPNLIEDFEERFGLRIVEAYSLTEAPALALNPVTPENRRLGSQGLQPAEKFVRIVDEDGDPVPPNTPGEITLKGPDVMDRYHDNPEKTAEAITDGWVHTGDLGKLDEDGFFYFLDRMDDTIRRSGENISSMEVENVIRELDAVTEVAVIPVPDEFRDEEVKALVIPDGDLQPETIVSYCEQHLSGFKIPRYIEFVDELPATETEKIQKSKLREREREENPDDWDREAVDE